MVVLMQDPESWRRPGCDQRCQERVIITSMPMRRMTEPVHDPDAHEQYGLMVGVGETQVIVRTGALVVNLTGKTAHLAERLLLLTGREWTVLETLATARGGVVSILDLKQKFFGDDSPFYDTNSIRMWVNRLRGKMRGADHLIQTRIGLGYCLVMQPPTDTLPLRPLRRWAQNWDCCQRCGTTDRPHDGRGMCGPCRSVIGPARPHLGSS